ncbi:hypothetical protein ABIB06_002512 [Bradyrhizobium sp. LB8.2]
MRIRKVTPLLTRLAARPAATQTTAPQGRGRGDSAGVALV